MNELHKKYTINNREVNEENYRMYEFLTNKDEDKEMLFNLVLDDCRTIGSAIVRFQKHIRENRKIDFDEILKACSNKNILDCKGLLEELFLEPIDIECVAIRMNRQGWSLENLILEHKRRTEKRIHRILNIPYSVFIQQ